MIMIIVVVVVVVVAVAVIMIMIIIMIIIMIREDIIMTNYIFAAAGAPRRGAGPRRVLGRA